MTVDSSTTRSGQPAQDPEITAAEQALKAAEQRAREAQIEVSHRISEVQEARLGIELARAEVELKKSKPLARTSDEKIRIKAIESRVSALRSLIREDLPAVRAGQGRLIKAQAEDPGAVAGLQVELMNLQRRVARKQLEVEIASLRTTGGDPARIQAMERRLEELKRQSPDPAGGQRKPDAGTRGAKPEKKK